jgi:hypothetical protein
MGSVGGAINPVAARRAHVQGSVPGLRRRLANCLSVTQPKAVRQTQPWFS